MGEFSDLPSIAPGVYEHYKGKRYLVLGVGCHTEVHDYFVVYTPLYEHAGQPDIWLRPYDMFIETVEVQGEVLPRFKKITES
jgi:hypothetical protein